jgi:hypothetical protein
VRGSAESYGPTLEVKSKHFCLQVFYRACIGDVVGTTTLKVPGILP